MDLRLKFSYVYFRFLDKKNVGDVKVKAVCCLANWQMTFKCDLEMASGLQTTGSVKLTLQQGILPECRIYRMSVLSCKTQSSVFGS